MKSITSIFANYNKLQLILPKYHIQALSVAAILAAILNFSERHQPCQIMLAISDPTDITRHLGIYHDMLTDGVRPHLHLSSDCHPTKWFFHVFVKTKTYIYLYNIFYQIVKDYHTLDQKFMFPYPNYTFKNISTSNY